MESTNVTQKFSFTNKKVLYALICIFVLILIVLYSQFSSINKHNKDLSKKIGNQNLIVMNQTLLITNLTQKNSELSVLLSNYDSKLSILHTNMIELQSITEKLKLSSDEKDIKIKDLTQEKSALESDFKVAKTDKAQNELLSKIELLTKERDLLKNKIVEYEKIIEELKKENVILAQNLRQSVKKSGYEFKNKLGEWPKGGEVLMRMSSYHTNNSLKENSNVSEPKQDEKPKKVGFWKRIFGSGETE